MLKHIYRIVTCIIVFVVCVVVFGRNIHKERYKQEIEYIEHSNATFPVMTAKCKGYDVCTLHGYITSLDPTLVRDGIIPMDEGQTIDIEIVKNDTKITKGAYEVYDIRTGDKLEDGSISSFEENEGKLAATIKLENEYTAGQEYSIVYYTTTDKGDKIKFYSRIKKIDTSNFDEIISYAMDFHKNVLNKDTASKVVSHIEPDSSMDNKDLAYVNIHSSLDLISYGDLSAKVITQVRPTVREISDDTGMIELEFYVQAKTGSGKETYKVCEAFRIRWTATRMYLLAYDRTMESVFDIELVSIAKNEFKLGITNDVDENYIATKDESRLAFVRNGELWYYNTALNEMYSIYSFMEEETDYIRDIYNNHNIKILGMDDFGNMDFMVYGYMNSGEYEGRVGIILYKYYAADNRIEEQIYIPVNIPYDILKGYVSDFAYVNGHNVFFFSLGESIYSYDMITDELKVIATGIKEENMVMPESGSFMAWMDSDELDAAINVMDLENEDISQIVPPDGKCIRLLGGIGANVIYGYANKKDIDKSADGTTVIPINRVIVSGIDGVKIKEYKPDTGYVAGSQVLGNKIRFELVEKDSNGCFVPIKEDYMFNNDVVDTQIKTSYRLTDKTMTEWYLSIPKSVNISEKPVVNDVNITKVEEKVVRVDLETKTSDSYYVYSYHGLEQQFDNAGEAIVMADERMGVVYDNKGVRIWERGAAKDSAKVSVNNVSASTSIEACIKMVLETNHIEYGKKDSFKIKDGSITQMLEKYMPGKVVNLTGATLEEVLLYVSEGKPVIAMLSSSRAVLITEYTQSKVVYIDPLAGRIVKKTKDASKEFEKVGNIFISYVQ